NRPRLISIHFGWSSGKREEAVDILTSQTRIDPVLRWMVHMDLPKVVRISQQGAGLEWGHEDFLGALRSINTVGHVAEIGNDVVGFMIYKIRRDSDADQSNDIELPRSRFTGFSGNASHGPLQIDLLNIAVSPELHHHGIARAMAQRLEQKIQREGGCIHAIV